MCGKFFGQFIVDRCVQPLLSRKSAKQGEHVPHHLGRSNDRRARPMLLLHAAGAGRGAGRGRR